ncbi:flagellar basal body P-ring formation chaperone FlgA [Undibacterium sp. TS12]|uniref:flagellar basal body P-ring formation chaperone FlgA n=1 Tax=Undibacterium sp. TS12 TaxID=2908202 RepID=UPI001F4C7DE7|nr:flagellar basal body P-ring formation chaperone FlgA [Undibacterium sp. TS12]MCH8619026.1 flagellar basal body P-ring formation protein FlgA [Undibacterium sp. TS12]
MKTPRILRKILSASIVLSLAGICQAAPFTTPQDMAQLRQLALDFLTLQASGQSGQVQVSVGEVDKRLNLQACENPSPSLPPGSKPWGKVTVAIRCTVPTPWMIYLQANVQVTAEYYVAANSLAQGQILTMADLSKVKGDISKLPAGVITSPEQAIGKTIQVSIPSGSVLRTDALKSPAVIQQGQSVRVVSSGPGFQVATDAIALNNAADGQIAKAKTSSGQTVSGVAKIGGIIEIVY